MLHWANSQPYLMHSWSEILALAEHLLRYNRRRWSSAQLRKLSVSCDRSVPT